MIHGDSHSVGVGEHALSHRKSVFGNQKQIRIALEKDNKFARHYARRGVDVLTSVHLILSRAPCFLSPRSAPRCSPSLLPFHVTSKNACNQIYTVIGSLFLLPSLSLLGWIVDLSAVYLWKMRDCRRVDIEGHLSIDPKVDVSQFSIG